MLKLKIQTTQNKKYPVKACLLKYDMDYIKEANALLINNINNPHNMWVIEYLD